MVQPARQFRTRAFSQYDPLGALMTHHGCWWYFHDVQKKRPPVKSTAPGSEADDDEEEEEASSSTRQQPAPGDARREGSHEGNKSSVQGDEEGERDTGSSSVTKVRAWSWR